ncbi:nuclear transcription factor Y subunit A-1-like [Hibiscus syriacus]|uniref:Translocation protein SEC62 n=1 Tax=Hibiscus syriacus TaxID=106335 RepID=A0A6A2YVA1_HIBSY|nr:nuclear transcription factor Y subunit A-1-like [Hibiscus syriacus]
MKKSGAAEKKKARRSSAAVQNGSRDQSSFTPSKKQAAKKDVFQLFAEKVRDRKDLESRWAILQETRVEYFRGKDFVNFIKNHPELKDILESDRNLETEVIANSLLQKNLLHHAPDEAARARYQKRVSNIIDDVLEWSPSLALSGMMEKQTMVNATESNDNSMESKVTSETVFSAEETDQHHNDTAG